MNQVAIAKTIYISGSIRDGAYNLGFSLDGKTYVNNIENKEANMLFNLNGGGEFKSILLPKEREVKFSLLIAKEDKIISYKIPIVENNPIDFYIVDCNDTQNDYKYNVYVEPSEYMEGDYSKVSAKVNLILNKLRNKYDCPFNIDDLYSEDGKLCIDLDIPIFANIKIVGKNVKDNTLEENKIYLGYRQYFKNLLDKHIQQFGINHREYDNSFYESIINDNYLALSNTVFNNLFTIRFKNPRVASVTHDEDLYQNVYILATEAVGNQLKTIFGIS